MQGIWPGPARRGKDLIPIKDDSPLLRRPYATMALLALNLMVYFYQALLPPRVELLLVHQYGLVPVWLSGWEAWGRPPQWIARPFTLITYQFLHGSIFHVGFNLLYLWIFGGKVEDALGRLRFVIFYLLGGVLAGMAQVLAAPGSPLPVIGASGAVAAVLGAYLVLYPRNHILVLFWFFFFVRLIPVPALVFLGIWFALQVLNAGSGSVAWMAHIGGFVAGMLMVRCFLPRPPAPW